MDRPITGELRDEIDLSTWRVHALPSDFADRVLDRLDVLEADLDDARGALDDEIEPVSWSLDDEAERVATVRSMHGAQRSSRAPLVVGVVAAAAAALLVWLWPDAPAPSLPASSSPPPVAAPDVERAPAAPIAAPHAEPRPTARVPEPSAEPLELDRDKIREAVREQFIPEAKRCYNELLRRDPAAQGRVTLRIDVVRDGQRGIVEACEVVDDQSDLADATLRACLVAAMKALIFDAPAGDGRVQIVYPVVFRPGENGERGVIVGP
jgi:hypothetical protein